MLYTMQYILLYSWVDRASHTTTGIILVLLCAGGSQRIKLRRSAVDKMCLKSTTLWNISTQFATSIRWQSWSTSTFGEQLWRLNVAWKHVLIGVMDML